MTKDKNLYDAAKEIRDNSYSPYSQYKVACALRCKDGHIFTGVNVENASYGATICAERSAIVNAITAGNKEIEEYLILTDEEKPWAPCGVCRQVMIEFSSAHTKVTLANLKGHRKTILLSELVPFSFTKKQLDKM